MWLDHLKHVLILIFYCKLACALTILLVDDVCCVLHNLLLLCELICIMVSNDVRKLCFGNVTLHICKMEEAFVAFCLARCLCWWKHSVEFHSNKCCVYHDILCITWMNVYTVELNISACCIKVFIFYCVFLATVYRICEVSTETCNIEVVSACADFLVWCEADANLSVWLA